MQVRGIYRRVEETDPALALLTLQQQLGALRRAGSPTLGTRPGLTATGSTGRPAGLPAARVLGSHAQLTADAGDQPGQRLVRPVDSPPGRVEGEPGDVLGGTHRSAVDGAPVRVQHGPDQPTAAQFCQRPVLAAHDEGQLLPGPLVAGPASG